MKTLTKKYLFLPLFIMGISVAPLCAQMHKVLPDKKPFIHQGEILAGFSFSFSNASGRGFGFNSGVARETTNTYIQLNGLYFVSDHIGVGPLLGYQFRYVDWSDLNARNGQFEFGAQGGYYIPLSAIFNSQSDIYFFVNGAVSWLRRKYPIINTNRSHYEYDFGFRIGPGFLFPVGKRIAIQTALQFNTRRQKYIQFDSNMNRQFETYKWPVSVGLSIGLRVRL